MIQIRYGLNYVLQKSTHWTLNHHPSQYDLIEREDLYRGNEVHMKLLGKVLIKQHWCPYEKERFEHRDKYRGGKV